MGTKYLLSKAKVSFKEQPFNQHYKGCIICIDNIHIVTFSNVKFYFYLIKSR